MVNIIADYIPAFAPLPNIAPFTYKDGETYLSTLDNLRTYVNTTLVTFVNTNYASIADATITEINAFITTVNSEFDTQNTNLSESLATVNSLVTTVNGLVTDVNNSLSAANTAVDAANTALDTANEASATANSFAIANDDAVAGYISTTGISATKTALNSSISTDITTPASEIGASLSATYATYANLPEILASKYGVLGDGVTDSFTALQELIANASAAGGGHIKLPKGDVVLSDGIKAYPNVTISGAGRDVTILKVSKYAFGYATDSTPPATQSNPLQNFHVRDMTIDGAGQTGAYKGIALQFVIGSTFENLRIKNTQMTGLGIDFLKDCLVFNVITEDTGLYNDGTIPGGNGIGIGVGGFSDNEESALITGCHVYRAKRSGIVLERSGNSSTKGYKVIGNYAASCGDVGIQDGGAMGAIFTDNVSDSNAGHGFAVSKATIDASGAGYAGNMSNNFAFGNGGDGFHFDTTDEAQRGTGGYTFSGNTAYMNVVNGFYFVTGGSDVSGLVVIGNTANRNPSSGIRISSLGAVEFIGCEWSHNLLLENGTAGGTVVNSLRLDANMTDCVVKDNRSPSSIPSPLSAYVLTVGRTRTRCVISGNRTSGSTTAWTVAGTNTLCEFRDNEEYNNVGPSAVTVGASPFTYTALGRPETLYVDGGTVSTITKSGITLRTSTGCEVQLAPNEAVTVTYSSAPTMVTDIR